MPINYITGDQTPGGGATPSARAWDATPGHATPGAATPGRGDETPGHKATPSARKNRWDETPKTERGGVFIKLVAVIAHLFNLQIKLRGFSLCCSILDLLYMTSVASCKPMYSGHRYNNKNLIH